VLVLAVSVGETVVSSMVLAEDVFVMLLLVAGMSAVLARGMRSSSSSTPLSRVPLYDNMRISCWNRYTVHVFVCFPPVVFLHVVVAMVVACLFPLVWLEREVLRM
jgi:hypothetical protein